MPENEKNELSLKQRLHILFSILLSLFWVICIWRVWERGVSALGINVGVFLFALLIMFSLLFNKKEFWQKKNLSWIVPLLLIILSFAIYENPFIKWVNIFVYPILFIIFINYGLLQDARLKRWSLSLILSLSGRILDIFDEFKNALENLHEFIFPHDRTDKKFINRILLGLLLLFLVAFIIVIPLLSSADQIFAERMSSFYVWIGKIISFQFVLKIIAFFILTVIISACFLAWKHHFQVEQIESEKKKDSLVAGIVLVGVLVLYLLFLWIQIERLWINSLPIDFKETESIVKSGFWQLLFLSIFNIGAFFLFFKKTDKIVQIILGVFTFASVLLLASAGLRMALYVIYYGFSYEKFYASYTVIYCFLLFIWLISNFFRKKRTDIVKFVVFLFLWMFSIITILPAEQFILRANIALKQQPDSRIKINELKMLSIDVLRPVTDYQKSGQLDQSWNDWVDSQNKLLNSKALYEYDAMDFLFKNW